MKKKKISKIERLRRTARVDDIVATFALGISLVFLFMGKTLLAIYWMLVVIVAVIPPIPRPWLDDDRSDK